MCNFQVPYIANSGNWYCLQDEAKFWYILRCVNGLFSQRKPCLAYHTFCKCMTPKTEIKLFKNLFRDYLSRRIQLLKLLWSCDCKEIVMNRHMGGQVRSWLISRGGTAFKSRSGIDYIHQCFSWFTSAFQIKTTSAHPFQFITNNHPLSLGVK
jgi:hypothetical protein